MASSSKAKMRFRIFLSFRGEDVRQNFIGHLCTALDQTGIFTYNDIDNTKEFMTMREAMAAPVTAIQESHIAIIAFSKNYVHSKSCLIELAEIMDCHVRMNQIVLPVFYKVEPSRIRHWRDMKSRKHRMDSETMKRWKEALYSAGDLFGWYLGNQSSEATLVKDIVETISELIRFDVYLSFNVEDVCENFVESLNEALVKKGIKTFMDSENLRMGPDFPVCLMDAIEHSRMHIVFFSEKYAESWCGLKELVHILERKNRKKQPMLPIFYKVEPGTVRTQKKSYGEALDKHEKEYGMRKVKKWREALSEAANVNGIHVLDGNEDDCIREIAEWVEKMVAEIK